MGLGLGASEQNAILIVLEKGQYICPIYLNRLSR